MLIGIVACAGPVRGQQVVASFSADSVSIGERFSLSIEARHDAGLQVLLPAPADTDSMLGDFLVLIRASPTTLRIEGGAIATSITFDGTTFALDSARVPPLPVRFVNGADTLTRYTPLLVLPVRSMAPADAEGIKDLAPLVEFPGFRWIGLFAACLAAIALWLAYRRRKSGRAAPLLVNPEMVTGSPYEVAMRQLEALAAADLDVAPDVRPYYIRLTDILRGYLERVSGIPAYRATSGELIDYIRTLEARAELPDGLDTLLRDVLDPADLAKFARFRPPGDSGRAALNHTRTAIQRIDAFLREKTAPAKETHEPGEAVPADLV